MIANGATLLWPDTANVNEKGDDLDTTTFESGGVADGRVGITEADFDFKGNWDAGNVPTQSPPALYVQDTYGPVKIYTNVSDNNFWNMALTRLLATQTGTQVRGKVTYGVNGKSQGAYQRP